MPTSTNSNQNQKSSKPAPINGSKDHEQDIKEKNRDTGHEMQRNTYKRDSSEKENRNLRK